MDIKNIIGRGIAGLGIVFAGMLLAGCETDSTPSYTYNHNPLITNAPPAAVAGSGNSQTSTNDQALLRVGDDVIVNFADLGVNGVAPVDDQIKSDGSITLIYNQRFDAAGKSVGELQAEIRKRYVPAYFVNMTPTVKVQDRFYSVGGEVRTPNRFLWTGSMSVLLAINTAGGFGDFANKKNVSLTRVSGEVLTVNCKKALVQPELDLPVYPGDKIHVKKRLW